MVAGPSATGKATPERPGPGRTRTTPRAWASLSRALDLAEQAAILGAPLRRALSFGRVSGQDAATFCALAEHEIEAPHRASEYISGAEALPADDAARWFVLNGLRETVEHDMERSFRYDDAYEGLADGWRIPRTSDLVNVTPAQINRFLLGLPQEHRFALLVDLVQQWGALGAAEALLTSLREVTGL
jgi:hypothetical protein